MADSSLLRLRRAVPDDLDAIMAIERVPGFEAFVGRSERPEHLDLFASSRFAYFVGETAAEGIQAFAILRDIEDPHGNVYLKRYAVARTGQGLGSAFLVALTDWTFANTKAHRFYLDCFVDNARARALYAKHGFTVDGTLREAYLAPDGRRRDLALMALLRPEWLARRGD